jgi:hypothetical protein
MVGPDKPQIIIQYRACALHAGLLWLQTHSEYLTHTAFPLQQSLRYTCFTCLVNCYYFGEVYQLSEPEKVVRSFNRNVGVTYVET